MEKYVYNADSLDALCAFFERTYDMSSDDFYAAHVADEELPIPRFHRHVWSSFLRESRRLHGRRNGDFTSRAEKVLAPV